MKILVQPFIDTTVTKLKDYLLAYYGNGYLWALQQKQHEMLLENCGYTSDIVNSLWKLIVVEKSIQDSKIIENKERFAEIKKDIENSKDIFVTCSKFKIQPMLLKKHLDKKYFSSEYGYKEKFDLFGAYQSELARKKGQDFEKRIHKVLVKAGYSNFITEGQQKALKNKNNAPTPDFLYKEKFDFFKYKDIRWIEVKSYPGFDKAIFYYGILKQVKKYSRTYGKGILLLNHGFTKTFKEIIEKKTNGKVIVLAVG